MTEDLSSQSDVQAPAEYSARQVMLRSAVASVASSVLFVTFLALFAYSYRGEIFPTQVASIGAPYMETGSSTQSEPIVTIVERTAPAVVSVVVTKDIPILERYYESIDPWGGWGPFGEIQVPRVREKGTEEREVGGGTGFFVSDTGLLVTNRHVVDDDEARYSIVTNTGESYDAEVLVRDPQMDIAVLKVKDIATDEYTWLSFDDSSALKAGQTVIAIGNALSEFRNSVSVGVISGLARSITAGDFWGGESEVLSDVIQTDAAINPGNSGGPLIGLSGKVVGVNVAVAGGAENIGFAIPANVVESIVTSVEKYGEIRRPFLGVRFIPLTPAIAKNNELSVEYGAWLRGGVDGPAVLKGSPAEEAGLRENDIITSFGGTSLEQANLSELVRSRAVDERVEVVYIRGGEKLTTEVRLTTAPKE